MRLKLLNVGFGNFVVSSRIVAIIHPGSAPMKRMKEEAREHNKLVDATSGRKTRAVLITDSDHVILSAVNPETAALRMMGKHAPDKETDEDADVETLDQTQPSEVK